MIITTLVQRLVDLGHRLRRLTKRTAGAPGAQRPEKTFEEQRPLKRASARRRDLDAIVAMTEQRARV